MDITTVSWGISSTEDCTVSEATTVIGGATSDFGGSCGEAADGAMLSEADGGGRAFVFFFKERSAASRSIWIVCWEAG